MTRRGLTRRDFIKVSVLAGGGMLIEACSRSAGPTTTTATTTTGATATTATTTMSAATTPAAADPDAVFESGLRVRIDGTGAVTVIGHRTEMGQGILTALAMIAAEELDADWAKVSVEQADADPAIGTQITGGSTAIAESFLLMRQAGAVARARLVAAAAARWGVDPAECVTEAGVVRHAATDRILGYGELVTEAASADPEALPPATLKEPEEFRIIGTPTPLAHSPAVVTGTAEYGSDVRFPGMRHAAVAYPPILGSGVDSIDAGPALAVDGVEQVFEIDSGVAVVADSTWAALRGRDALEVAWNDGRASAIDSAALRAEFIARHSDATVYDHPFYAHMTIEPTCCAVELREDSCEVWAPVQDPGAAKRMVQAMTGLSADSVALHIPLSGGRFGRGLHPDYVEDAVLIAREAGAPVKLIRTREDDLRRDFFHPIAVVAMTADPADPFQTIRASRNSGAGIGVPTGNWRSVGHFTDAFAHESFVDELAVAAGVDPVAARLSMLDDRGSRTVQLAADRAGWGEPLPAGWGRGIAYHATWSVTRTAMVAEVSIDDLGTIRVHRVVCAVDAGLVINPDTVRAQMEGGIAWGLSAALHPGVDITASRVVPSNFDDAPILRYEEMPEVEVHLLDSDESPSGIGEMGVPPVAPAVANAVYAATGRRLRSLPLRLRDGGS